jgi:hypothetical protein
MHMAALTPASEGNGQALGTIRQRPGRTGRIHRKQPIFALQQSKQQKLFRGTAAPRADPRRTSTAIPADGKERDKHP